MDILDEGMFGPRFEIVTGHIAQILSQSRGGYSRWRRYVFSAAIEMAESGEYPTGPRLEFLSEMYAQG